MRIRMALAALAVVALSAPTAWAQNLPLKAFFGHYQGNGIAESADSLYFGVTMRDMDVVIEPSGQGFIVAWTTVIRQGGDPNNPDVRRKGTEIEFLKTANPLLFRSGTSRDPMDGGQLAWARIKKNTLHVYLMAIDENGVYSVQSYARTLTGEGMELVFGRITDGQPIR
ncbi:MAG: hypothetical protein HOK81_10245, partial [Rhodospirillaceae bacterium]|nr:hypothetical protein [Rhodospirillaceae bacterium]